MKITETKIAGVLLIETQVLEDERGFFLESQRASALASALGRAHIFAQSNHSRSAPNVLRGFRKEPWDKLIYVARGTALCAVGDPRPESATFGQSETFLLGDAPGARARLFVPKGVCNAFYAITEVDYINDVSAEFDPNNRAGFIWNDPTFAVQWPSNDPILTKSDENLPTLRSLFPNHRLYAEAV